jgi:hypothetical protein
MCRTDDFDPIITTSFLSDKVKGFVRFKQEETRALPRKHCTALYRGDIPQSLLSNSFRAASAAISTLPQNVQEDIRLQIATSLPPGIQKTCVMLEIAHDSLTKVLNSPIIRDLMQSCEDNIEVTIPLKEPGHGLLDCIALQMGFAEPYESLQGTAEALYGVQVPCGVQAF